jgi:sugar/nucleoside kinase (ribokinase family)
VVSLGVVGHIAVDRIISADGVRHQLGGPPTYISLITHMLGYPLVAATRVGWDFPKEYASELALRGVEVYVDWTKKTTRFVLDYTKLERGLGYDSLCSNITPSEVKDLPDTCILAPIVEEIPKETLVALGSRTLALDPQGFVRKLLPGGLICLRRWHDETLLRRLSVFKASTRELRLVVGESGWGGLEKLSRLGVLVAIETRGGEGANILSSGKRIVAPAFQGKIIDPTGAGDAFIAGFMSEYASGEDVEWCAAVGSAAASAVVETVGPVVTIGKEELLKRAENLLLSLKILP